jgi:hypothetical protein
LDVLGAVAVIVAEFGAVSLPGVNAVRSAPSFSGIVRTFLVLLSLGEEKCAVSLVDCQ